jgi:hypothetical protein
VLLLPEHVIKVVAKTNPFPPASGKGKRFARLREFDGRTVAELAKEQDSKILMEALLNRVRDKTIEVWK